MSDSDCAAFATPATTTPVVTPVAGSTGGPGISTGGSTGGSGTTSFGLPTGQSVLGASTGPATTTASTTCGELIKEYMKKGKKNTPSEVKKLQNALNNILGTKIPATGYFGSMTDKAVRTLQSKYSDAILAPWVNIKQMNKAAPTGYVYKTTQWYINTTICGGSNVPAPMLP